MINYLMRLNERFEIRLVKLSLIASLPMLLLAILAMSKAKISIWLILLAGLFGCITIVYAAYQIYFTLTYQFRGLNNLLGALIQGDYNLRGHAKDGYGSLNEVVLSINILANRLSDQRLESVESQILVRTIIDHIDTSIIAIDEKQFIRFVNPGAKTLLNFSSRDEIQRLPEALNFTQSLAGGRNQIVELTFGAHKGRFNVHVEEFRVSGKPHKLLFIQDVGALLRTVEIQAWQSLVRVFSHEINNSLTPIASLSQTLSRIVTRQNIEDKDDLISGLAIISERSKSLSRFVDSYKQLTKLPHPQKENVSLRKLVTRLSALFPPKSILLVDQEDIEVHLDPVLIEQMLINLIKNAREAMDILGSQAAILISWRKENYYVRLSIKDSGGGIANPENLFVPFYSTKKNGSGIGLILCQQIAEAHNGKLSIINWDEGAIAIIDLPLNEKN